MCEGFGEEKYRLPVQGIEMVFNGFPVCNLIIVTILSDLSTLISAKKGVQIYLLEFVRIILT